MLISREILTGVGTCFCDERFIRISWRNYIGVIYVYMSTMFELQILSFKSKTMQRIYTCILGGRIYIFLEFLERNAVCLLK